MKSGNIAVMKLNSKQIDNIARVLGTLAASSIIGAMVGIARPDSVTSVEEAVFSNSGMSLKDGAVEDGSPVS